MIAIVDFIDKWYDRIANSKWVQRVTLFIFRVLFWLTLALLVYGCLYMAVKGSEPRKIVVDGTECIKAAYSLECNWEEK